MLRTPLQKIRDDLFLLIDQHEAEDHGGSACAQERVNAIAFLMHCLGLDERFFPFIKKRLDHYDRECRGCNQKVTTQEDSHP